MSFDAEKIRDEIVQWIRDWFEENGKGCKAVVGLSGGKDSSVVAALCVEALGKENVFGVMMPNGEQFDIDVSHKLAEHLGIKSIVVNIKDAYEGIVGELAKHFDSFEGESICRRVFGWLLCTLYLRRSTAGWQTPAICRRTG